MSRYLFTPGIQNCQAGNDSVYVRASLRVPDSSRIPVAEPNNGALGRALTPSPRTTKKPRVRPSVAAVGRRRPRFADLPGVLRALLQEVACGATLYIPRHAPLSDDDRLLAQYLYYRWIAGFKHHLAVAEAAAVAGLSVDTVSRRLREIRRARAETMLDRARRDSHPLIRKP